ncbi:MAG: PrgI family protein [Acetatifactor sp.]
MVIEINKDIDRYKESVVMGLTAKQLIFSVASVVAGGGIVLLLYRYIGLTPSVYVAIPVAAPIALGGFYSFNGMNFYEVMDRKIRMLFANHPLTYISTEGEAVIKEFMQEEAAKGMKDKKKKEKASQIKENKKEFEAVKKKTKKMVIGTVMAMVLAAVGIVIYRMKR